MVMVLAFQAAVTPVGKPVAAPIPVAPVVVCVILVSGVLIQSVGADEATLAVFTLVTVIVPIALTAPQPPNRGIE